MEWQIVVALIIAIPIILIPVVFVWFLNFGGILAALKEARSRRAAQSLHTEELAKEPVEK